MAYNPQNPNGQATGANSTPVVIASDQTTIPVSATTLPLPAGASTESTLSALNTKVTAVNTGAVTISTALPTGTNIIGSVTSNIGTTGGLALDTTLTGGSTKAIVRSATKGTSISADITSDPTDANTQALHVNLKGIHSSVPVTGTFFQAIQPVSGVLTDTQLRATAVPVSNATLPLPTGASTETTLAALNTKVTAVNTGAVTISVALPIGTNTIGNVNIIGTVPVSATALPLPTGASTETTLAALNAKVTAVNTGAVTIASGAIPANATFSGTLSASDAVVAAPVGDGTLISGASTAGSIVAIAVPNGFVAWTLLIKAYASGTIYTEASTNSTNGTDGDWTEVKGRKTGTAVGVESISYAQVANGYYRGNAAGFTYLRARLIGGVTPTISWYVSAAQGATFLNSGIPSGGSIIGKVGIDLTTPGTTNLVSIGTNGTVAINTALPTGTNTIGAVNVIGTVPVSASSLPLPTGASTETTLAALNTKVTAVNTGAVTISTALPTGTNTIGALTANQSVNHSQVNGIAISTGNGVSGTGVQRVNIASDNTPITTNIASNGLAIGARPDGFIRTQIDPVTLLFDTFESLDTTNTWTLGGTAVPTGAGGVLTINAVATISATSYASSKAFFIPSASGYLQMSSLITFEAATTTGTNRFWGLGVLTTPTTTVPITNGTIFEIDTTGALFGSVYSAGAKTQSIALTKASDGTIHRYAIYYKASKVYFEIDNISVGVLPFPNPTVSSLNIVIGQANSGTVTGANTLTATLLGLGDTGRNSSQISDGIFQWRKATVKPASTAILATDTTLSVGLHPSTPLPTGTNTIGAVNIIGTVPVSATALPLPIGASTETTLAALNTKVTAVNTGAVTISAALPTGTNTIGAVTNTNLDVALSTRLKPTDTLSAVTTVSAVTAITNALPIGTNVIGKVGIDQTTPGTTNLVSIGTNGTVAINTALPTGTNTIGTVNIIDSDLTASGSITTQNLNPNSGVATAGSTLATTTLAGDSTLSIQITGAYTGALTIQASIDGSNWIAISNIQNVNTGLLSPNIASATVGIFVADVAGCNLVRITALGAQTGTAVITLRASVAPALISLDSALPTGTNTIGAITNANLDVALSTRLKPADTLAAVTTVGAVTAITNALPTGTNTIGAVNVNGVVSVTSSAPSNTYGATMNGLALAALATDVFTISGSATKTIRINKISFAAIQTTAGQVAILLIRRSTANTAGTSTSPVNVTYDTANVASTAVSLAYTANPTLGTAVGAVYSSRVFVPGAATATDAQGLFLVGGDVGQQYFTLRGVAQQLCINLNGVTLAGGSANISIEWTES